MPDGGEADVVYLRMAAPRRATSDRDFEFARQVKELRISGEHLRNLTGERRGVDQLVRGDSCKRAAGYVANYVSAGSFWREANCGESIHHFRERFNSEPVK